MMRYFVVILQSQVVLRSSTKKIEVPYIAMVTVQCTHTSIGNGKRTEPQPPGLK